MSIVNLRFVCDSISGVLRRIDFIFGSICGALCRIGFVFRRIGAVFHCVFCVGIVVWRRLGQTEAPRRVLFSKRTSANLEKVSEPQNKTKRKRINNIFFTYFKAEKKGIRKDTTNYFSLKISAKRA